MQNKKLRKALAVSMAIAMTGGLLAGCGSNNSSSSNGGQRADLHHPQAVSLTHPSLWSFPCMSSVTVRQDRMQSTRI